MVFLLPDETRSACGASADLSACCVGGASLCDYDAKSRYRQVNRFSCQYRLFTSDLRSCTTALPLGLLSAAAAGRVLWFGKKLVGLWRLSGRRFFRGVRGVRVVRGALEVLGGGNS